MLRKFVLAVAAIMLLTACGGSEPADRTDKAPSEKVYSAKDLKAALPSLDEIPNGRKLLKQCPGAKDCVAPVDGTETWSVDFELAPESLVDLETEKKFFAQLLALVSVTQLASEADATARLAKWRRGYADETGPFETKAKENPDKTYTPGLRGEGKIDDSKHGKWSGFKFDKKFVLTGPDGQKSEPRQDATVTLTSGRYRINVIVAYGGYDMADGAALKVAGQLVDEYLERLG